MYRSYNQAIDNLSYITNIKELKKKVCMYLLENKNEYYMNGLTFYEHYNNVIKDKFVTSLVSVNYEEFCGNIVTSPIYMDNGLYDIEMWLSK